MGIACARRTEALLVRFHVVVPELSLLDVCRTELPVLVWLVDARQKALALFILREMEEEFDDAGSVGMKMSLQIRDRAIAVVPEFLVVVRRVGDPSLRKISGCTRTISTSS